MDYIYQSSKPIDKFYGFDCPVTNSTMLTIYKEQLRQSVRRDLSLIYYIMELDKDYLKLESKDECYNFSIWVNLNLNHYLLVSKTETNLIEFDDKLELLEYLDTRWLVQGFLFIDCRTHIIDKHCLRDQIKILDLKLQDKISQGIEQSLEAEQVYEDDCHDYFDSIREGCKV
jgi:hypothetical protein